MLCLQILKAETEIFHFITCSQKCSNSEKSTHTKSMLNLGSWKDQNMSYQNHSTCSQINTCRANAWQTFNCRWHEYTTSDVKTCFRNRKILIFGDSRGRQLYHAIRNRFEGEGKVMDDLGFKERLRISNWHLESRFNLTHQSASGSNGSKPGPDKIDLKWVWQCALFKNFSSTHSELITYHKSQDLEDLPNLIIFNSLLLHQTRHCNSFQECKDKLETFKENFLDLIPFMRTAIQTGKTKIIWLANEDLVSEGLSDTSKRFDMIGWCNQVREESDYFVRKAIFDNFSNYEMRRIAFIGVNSESVYTKQHKKGELMIPLSDKTHLMVREEMVYLPDTLWVMANLVFNFACNGLMRFEGVDCCVSEQF